MSNNTTVELSIAATGDIFIIPNHALKVSELASYKTQIYDTASLNGIVLTDDNLMVQVWISSKDLHSDNCIDHGFVADGPTGSYRVNASVTSPVMSYLPAKMLANIKEGDTFQVKFGFVEDGSCITVTMELTAAQTKYHYRGFGNFEDALAHVGVNVTSAVCVEEGESKLEGHTMRDFMKFIESAEVDYYGFCKPLSDDDSVKFHIYDGKRQVNVAIADTAIVNLLFGENEVGIVKVDNEIADYDHIKHVSLDSSVDVMYPQLESVLGSTVSSTVCGIINEILSSPADDTIEGLMEVHNALVNVQKLVRKTAANGASSKAANALELINTHLTEDIDMLQRSLMH